MRHGVADKKLNRNTKQRKALLKNMVVSLVEEGKIETTQAKAKAIRGLMDKLIRKAQDGSVATRRVLAQFFGRRDVVNKLVDEVAPPTKGRTSGFTRILFAGFRKGDNAPKVTIELVDKKIEKAKPEKAAKAKKADAKKPEAKETANSKPAVEVAKDTVRPMKAAPMAKMAKTRKKV